MPGKRMLHENICESKKLARVSPLAETLYYRLMTRVDDNGNFIYDPVLICAYCLPHRQGMTAEQTDGLLKELLDVRNDLGETGLLALYTVGGRSYLHIRRFDEYQQYYHGTRLKAKCPAHPPELGKVFVSTENKGDVEPRCNPLQDVSSGADSPPKLNINKTETRNPSATHSLAISLRDYAFQTWKDLFGQKPTWKADYIVLAKFLKMHPGITTEEFQGRWQRYLKDSDPFVKKRGYSLRYFLSVFDAYIDKIGIPLASRSGLPVFDGSYARTMAEKAKAENREPNE